ncbi:MFS transporter [Nocardioides humilatus]|uniref:MFS transporter n=1 Tax=Nocardioides humilatus TaxID=2607660 RepID=A0A5B1LMJ2_9ACTN|nr:MFS transporter [Nocardioides humilatus]KAA1420857.1 MFS transporter [Nocardioides humilatus]
MADPTLSHQAEAPSRTARGLAGALLAAALMPLNSTMIAVAVPSIARTFHHDPADVTQALVATYLIAAIALQGPGGKLGDRLGHWRVCVFGQVVVAVGAVVGFLAPSLPVLAGSRVLMATGGALAVPATLALLRIELPPERRGRAFGTFGAIMASAAALGPIIGGVLVDAFGWEAVFVANLPVLLISALLIAGVDHTRDARPTAAFDWAGSVLLTAALALLVLGAESTDGAVLALVGAGLVLLTGFVVRERSAADPVIDFAIFRARPFAAGTLLVCLQNLVMYALIFEIPLVLEELFDLTARETGQLLIFLMAAMVLMSLVTGRLTDRLGPRTLAVAGSLVSLVGLVILLTDDLATSGEVRLPMALLGVGLGLCSPAAQTASMSAIAPEQSGMAAGVSSTMRYLGGVAGIAFLGRMLDLDGSAADIRSSHHTVLVVFTGVLCAALVCAALLPGRRPASVVSAEPQSTRP